jgi:hypothetical protein
MEKYFQNLQKVLRRRSPPQNFSQKGHLEKFGKYFS